jgi:hypothetical protein
LAEFAPRDARVAMLSTSIAVGNKRGTISKTLIDRRKASVLEIVLDRQGSAILFWLRIRLTASFTPEKI